MSVVSLKFVLMSVILQNVVQQSVVMPIVILLIAVLLCVFPRNVVLLICIRESLKIFSDEFSRTCFIIKNKISFKKILNIRQ